MPEDNVLPRAITDINYIRPVLKQIKRGKDPGKISAKYPSQDVEDTVNRLVAFGLVDHVALVAILQDQAQSGNYFLTDKGTRWLQTYDRWERFKRGLSKWQLLWGIILAISINILTSAIWPHIEEGIQRPPSASEVADMRCSQGVCVRGVPQKVPLRWLQSPP